MKLMHFATATAAVALLGGAASAQQAPTPGSVTGDWNGAHAPSDDKQYTEEVRIPIGAPPVVAEAPPPAEPAPAVATYAEPASVTTTVVTNGPVPDTDENRAKYGGPDSRAGKRTAPKGN